MAGVAIAGACGGDERVAEGARVTQATPASSGAQPGRGAAASPRTLGRTGATVEPFSLGGEGILRTVDRPDEAVPVIQAALRGGVKYCDTAPAYAQSQDYYGAAFRSMPGARDRVFLASKTHARDRDGALRLLDESLRKLGTDHVDLWQMHDLREADELDRLFGRGGAIEAAERAKADGRVRFVGLTGHYHPEILVEAMRRYEFDAVLVAINPSDPRRLPFLRTVVPEARRRGMGVIGMKALAVGRLLQHASVEECLRYTASFADTVIVGCSSVAEVEENLRIGRSLAPMSEAEQRALEARIEPVAARYDTFKA
jgi:predicted aldo/keto reductase-like oxidoreductase